jgi:hypothetical protein
VTATFVLQRHKDVSGVSGLGVVAHGAEFDDGSVALHWPGEHPSTAVWEGMRDVEAIHGHEGATLVEYTDADRLVKAYARVMPWLLSARYADRPTTVAPHPDHPDRLRLVFTTERVWRFWIALLDGNSDAAIHEQSAGGTEHRWTSPDGLLWLSWTEPTPGLTWENHDDPEVNR